jgi:predicted alpha/beta superfamily hydrolase
MTDDIRYHPDFPSEVLGNGRTLTVYLPPGYGRARGRRYPVFYLQDGQNLFDPATAFGGVPWAVDETAERLIREGTIEPAILVGIANTDRRLEEYGPKPLGRRMPGQSFPYARFVVGEVKPFIDRNYKTRPEREATAVGGSSLGGLISLFLAHRYPSVFGQCAALSPSLWWEDDLILRMFRDQPRAVQRTRFWLDTGTREGPSPKGFREQVKRTRQLAKLLLAAGLRRGLDFQYLEVEGGEHNEHAWADRFDQVVAFLFPRALGM